MQIDEDINKLINKYGVDRVSIVCGTSTLGIDNGEKALADKFPVQFNYKQQETAGLSNFLK
jgi:3-oxoacyl-[acyl-carrier-protein] synthase-1